MQFTEQIKERLNKIRQFKLQEDRAILLSCFGIALVFWILVKLSQEYTSQKTVSFIYEAPADLALVNFPPADVQATLKGTGWNLLFEHLAHSNIPIHFNIDQVGAFRLNRAQLRGEILSALASKELDITEVNYDEINLQAEPKVSKLVPISNQVQLSFAPEHHLISAVSLEPDSLTITGAASLVNQIDNWPTDSINFSELTNTVSNEVSLQKGPPEILLSHLKVQLKIPVEAYTEKSFFVPVTLLNAPADSLKVFPDKIKISFVVGLSQYDSIQYTDFKLEADLKTSSLEKGKNTVPVKLTLVPDAAKNIVLSGNSVEFFILKPNEARTNKVE